MKRDRRTEDYQPEDLAQSVVAACTDCDVCRYMMPSECLLFENLYRLHDRSANGGAPISTLDLRRLVDLCTYCGLCACRDIRADIIDAKTGFIAKEGLPFGVWLMTRLEAVARIGGRFPRLTNAFLRNRALAGLMKRLAGVHPARALPALPPASFPTWAAREGIDRKPSGEAWPKVAYFAGCTGRYLFPAVPRAVVQTLQLFGVSVYYPEQRCCGMPTFAEGDRRQTLDWVRRTIDQLAALVEEGFAIVCACPTCGYMLKTVIRDRADYAEARQAELGMDDRFLFVPDETLPARGGKRPLKKLLKSMYGNLLRDDGYFAGIDPVKRVKVAENTFDAGEYLLGIVQKGALSPELTWRFGRLVYFVPCHQREQQIGRPYLALLQGIAGLTMDVVDGPYDCCGMGGNMGFKKDFHAASLHLAAPVLKKIRDLNPDAIVTDCLSCRLQFMHALPYPVYHPMEIFSAAAVKDDPPSKLSP
ncbi:MAG: heterodisulfide reductase-related iron-sulfur binding cluster [Desulfobacteraceae bacterium]|nr:heterodisulfide reductase-related iron-sulfur binding cluster [Desulfobacteraceae bacterium]